MRTGYIIEVLNYCPYKVGFALSAKDGWFVGPHRFCGIAKARVFESREEAEFYIENRRDRGKYEFRILECRCPDA